MVLSVDFYKQAISSFYALVSTPDEVRASLIALGGGVGAVHIQLFRAADCRWNESEVCGRLSDAETSERLRCLLDETSLLVFLSAALFPGKYYLWDNGEALNSSDLPGDVQVQALDLREMQTPDAGVLIKVLPDCYVLRT